MVKTKGKPVGKSANAKRSSMKSAAAKTTSAKAPPKSAPPKSAPPKSAAPKSAPPKSAPKTAAPLKPSPTAKTAPIKKLPLVAVKPKKATRPSMPLPPPPPTPDVDPARDEMPAPRDIARLTRYGERFGAHKIDVRWLPIALPVTGTSLALVDPGAPKSWRMFDRPVGAGQFRAMLSIARTEDGKERLAAIVIHVGRPPIARWSVAHFKGQKKPKSVDQLPRVPVTTGWVALLDAGKDGKDAPGIVAVPATIPSNLQPVEVPLTDGRKALALPCGNGEFVSYWAVDASDKPICLVVDFDVFTQKDWKSRAPQ